MEQEIARYKEKYEKGQKISSGLIGTVIAFNERGKKKTGAGDGAYPLLTLAPLRTLFSFRFITLAHTQLENEEDFDNCLRLMLKRGTDFLAKLGKMMVLHSW